MPKKKKGLWEKYMDYVMKNIYPSIDNILGNIKGPEWLQSVILFFVKFGIYIQVVAIPFVLIGYVLLGATTHYAYVLSALIFVLYTYGFYKVFNSILKQTEEGWKNLLGLTVLSVSMNLVTILITPTAETIINVLFSITLSFVILWLIRPKFGIEVAQNQKTSKK